MIGEFFPGGKMQAVGADEHAVEVEDYAAELGVHSAHIAFHGFMPSGAPAPRGMPPVESLIGSGRGQA